MSTFDHIENWIFDLDNTLYPASCRLFDQIDQRMTSYLSDYLGVGRDEAYKLQKSYFRDHGTTMNGMMLHHQMDPEPYLQFVHDIDHSSIDPSPALASAIGALPGRKLVFTNGSASHAERVLVRLGIEGMMSDIFDIKMADYTPKPARQTYEMMIAATGIEAKRSAMFEDIARNLLVPHDMGMTTVLVKTPSDHADAGAIDLGSGAEPYVDHATPDLAHFLSELARN
ncbi:MAG: pyrimidine 5'-nucleotidase [Hyphomicrobiaceae bacterium]|nr:pyrimidine 5'-nucleotidase [Hyphomicrobiaceae bacterium]